MTTHESSLSVTLSGTPDLPVDALKALYRVTGRSTVELREAIRAGEPVYAAAVFGHDHIDVAPRLERTVALLEQWGLAFTVHETANGERDEIPLETMREILDAPADEG